MSSTRAFVLGGGGLAGAAWQIGLVAGLAEHGVDLRAADVVIGTSGGAVTAAQLAGAESPQRLFESQTASSGRDAEPASPPMRLPADLDVAAWKAGHDEPAVRARLGAVALRAPTPSEAYRLGLVAGRLPAAEWPDADVRVTAIDAASGELTVFGRADRVPLARAVAASCAVPTVWPPTTIGGRRYIDGGVRSITNADLAAGHDRVVVLSGIPEGSDTVYPTPIVEELRRLEGSQVLYLTPDAASLRAMLPSKMDPATRRPSALAGRRQAAAVHARALAVWRGGRAC